MHKLVRWGSFLFASENTFSLIILTGVEDVAYEILWPDSFEKYETIKTVEDFPAFVKYIKYMTMNKGVT